MIHWFVMGDTKSIFRIIRHVAKASANTVHLSSGQPAAACAQDRINDIHDITLINATWMSPYPLYTGAVTFVPPWTGRRWRHNGGTEVALAVQGWHTGCSNLAMDTMVAVKFWACSKQSHKGRRGGRSLAGRSKEAGGRHTHRRGRRINAQGPTIGRSEKKCLLL